MWNKRSRTALFAVLTLAGCGAVEDMPKGESPAPASQRAWRLGSEPIPLEEVPLDIHRRVAQLLEEVRGTESAPSWKEAVLAPEVRVLLRPDVEGVAYYEFRVLANEEPMGFVIASAGDHDFPIAHWHFEGLSPTESLAKEAGQEIAAFYKVDALTYVAEGYGGELLANLGELPPRIAGHDLSMLEKPIEPTTATYTPHEIPETDEKAEMAEGELVIEGPQEPAPLELDSWSSWEELKAGYHESFSTLAGALRLQAAGEWETETLVSESGEGLVLEQPQDVALLYPDASIDLSGEGAQFVQAELVESGPGTQKLVLTAVDAQSGAEPELYVTISYPQGLSEELRFVVLAPEDVGTPEGTAKAAVSKRATSDGARWAEPGAMNTWGPWSETFAGSHWDQRLYGQMPAYDWPNTSGCASGCGGTAWAMLFGWGDYQAALNHPGWWHRKGLYRENGGYGYDAVAHWGMDEGIRNITWELRNRMGTFCVPGGSGATFPWDMGRASGYLWGRSGAGISTHYNVLGIHEDRLRDIARHSIVNRRVPAIIGTGWLQHYPLAYGYRSRNRTVRKCFLWHCWNETETQREFFVNQGWEGRRNGWVGAGTWFAGQLHAN